jgi:hypothetical protein
MEQDEALVYPETILLGQILQELLFASAKVIGPQYYLSFIKQSQFEVTASLA